MYAFEIAAPGGFPGNPFCFEIHVLLACEVEIGRDLLPNSALVKVKILFHFVVLTSFAM